MVYMARRKHTIAALCCCFLLAGCSSQNASNMAKPIPTTTVTVTSTRTHTLAPAAAVPAPAPPSEPAQVKRDNIPATGQVIHAEDNSISFSREGWICSSTGCWIWSTFQYNPDLPICDKDGILAHILRSTPDPRPTNIGLTESYGRPAMCQDYQGAAVGLDPMKELTTVTDIGVPPGVRVEWGNGVSCTSNYNNLWCWRADGIGFRYQYPDATLTKIVLK